MSTYDLEAISLEQALIDVEVANERVIDLTARLAVMSQEVVRARALEKSLRLRTLGFRALKAVLVRLKAMRQARHSQKNHQTSDGFSMNTIDLDGISLEQALIDFEVANARVIDLTARLTSLSNELLRARSELEVLKLKGHALPANYVPVVSDNEEIRRLRSQLDQIRASRAVKIACFFGPNLRKVL